MSLSDYSSADWAVQVNGRPITQWGETDPPFTDQGIDNRNTLRRGQGGNAIKLTHPTPGRSVTLSLAPGGSDTAYLQGLFNSSATVSIVAQQIGTLEVKTGTEGVIVSNGSSGRGGARALSDDVYTLEFNIWTESRGGA